MAWLDLGMTGHLSENNKQLIKRAVMAILQNDIYEVKNVLLAMGETKDRVNHARLYTDIDDIVSKFMTMDFGTMHLGELIERLLDMVKDHHISITPDITMLGRSMITIEGTLSACAPDVNLLQILSSYMSSMIFNNLDFKKELRHKARLIYTSVDKSLTIPALLSDLLKVTKNGQTKLNIEFTDAHDLYRNFHRAVNRLSRGVIAAALFIGSALLSPMQNMPLMWGIPWISTIGFIISFILVLWIIIDIILGKKK